MPLSDPAHRVLLSLVEAIESTGGLVPIQDGAALAPVADLAWTDLASTYVDACRVLGREPLVARTTNAEAQEESPGDGGAP